MPEKPEEFIRQYTFSEADLSLIHQHRGAANRLGFAMQLCYFRFPGVVLGLKQLPAASLLAFVATQLRISVPEWAVYGPREQTRREHLLELQAAFGFQTFGLPHYRAAVPWLAEVARQTDKGAIRNGLVGKVQPLWQRLQLLEELPQGRKMRHPFADFPVAQALTDVLEKGEQVTAIRVGLTGTGVAGGIRSQQPVQQALLAGV